MRVGDARLSACQMLLGPSSSSFGSKALCHESVPLSDCTSFNVLGGSMLRMDAAHLEGCISIPLSYTRNPQNFPIGKMTEETYLSEGSAPTG